MYICLYVAHVINEFNTSELLIHTAFIEDDDDETLVSLVVVTFLSNLLISLFKLIMSKRIYITIINFVAVCGRLAAFRK
jgi:hypothetical protein